MKAEHYSKVQAAAIFAAFFFVAWFFILAPAYAATTTVTINLNPGWNLISQPFIEGFTIPTYTCQLQPNTKIWWFNADSSQQKYVAVDLNSLYNTVGGNGYWINVQSACTIAFSGTPATNLPLMHGWNLFGGIDAAGTTISQITSRCNIVYNTRIWGYDSDPSVKNYFPVSTASTLKQGAGYWVDIDSPSGCGVPASSGTTTTTTIATSSTTTTALSASSIVLNGHVTDTATVSPSSATGTVRFQVSTNGGITFTTYDTETLSSGSATSAPYTPPVLGTFYFRALYSGDSVYPASQSGNTAEMLMVVSSLPTTSTTTTTTSTSTTTTTTTSTSTTTTIAPTTTTTLCRWVDDGCGKYGCVSQMGQGLYCGGNTAPSNTRCVSDLSCTTSTTSTTSTTTTSTTTTTTTIPPVCTYTACGAPVPDACKCGIRTCGSGQYCCASYNFDIGICADYSSCFIACGM